MTGISLRTATVEDAAALLEIYRPYVLETAITFEYEVPTAAEFRQRIGATLERYPYLVAERDGNILGYAYAGAFHPRAAYSWCAELSIYVRKDAKKLGLGRLLYGELERLCALQNVKNANVCIAVPEVEDEYLTRNSLAFHEHLGYRLVGEFHRCGYKFGRWYNMVWMEKMLGDHGADPEPFIPFPEISTEKRI